MEMNELYALLREWWEEGEGKEKEEGGGQSRAEPQENGGDR